MTEQQETRIKKLGASIARLEETIIELDIITSLFTPWAYENSPEATIIVDMLLEKLNIMDEIIKLS